MDFDVIVKVVEVVEKVWPFVLFAAALVFAVLGISYWYINSDFHKYPWERKEAKEVKKKAREEARARKVFWEGN